MSNPTFKMNTVMPTVAVEAPKKPALHQYVFSYKDFYPQAAQMSSVNTAQQLEVDDFKKRDSFNSFLCRLMAAVEEIFTYNLHYDVPPALRILLEEFRLTGNLYRFITPSCSAILPINIRCGQGPGVEVIAIDHTKVAYFAEWGDKRRRWRIYEAPNPVNGKLSYLVVSLFFHQEYKGELPIIYAASDSGFSNVLEYWTLGSAMLPKALYFAFAAVEERNDDSEDIEYEEGFEPERFSLSQLMM